MNGAGMVNRYANPRESAWDYRTDDQRAYIRAGALIFSPTPFWRYLFSVRQTGALCAAGWTLALIGF